MSVVDVLESVEVALFASRYDDFPSGAEGRESRLEYLAEEISRVVESGQPILRAVLSRPGNGQCIDETLQLLRDGETPGGTQCPRFDRVTLRLAPGVKPPASDPNGNPIKQQFVGQVLVAKVGNTGANVATEATQRGTDSQRRLQLQTQRKLYRTVVIDRKGSSLSLSDAVIVLRAWGVGVATKLRHSLRDRSDLVLQDTWLVEEVVSKPEASPEPVIETTTPPRRKAS